MRNHHKLRAFELADALVLQVYQATRQFPREEMFGLTSQMRRAAISIASNIVEGCARNSQADFLHFLDIAYGSAQEVKYQLSLSRRLGFVDDSIYRPFQSQCEETCKVLNGLIQSLRKKIQ